MILLSLTVISNIPWRRAVGGTSFWFRVGQQRSPPSMRGDMGVGTSLSSNARLLAQALVYACAVISRTSSIMSTVDFSPLLPLPSMLEQACQCEVATRAGSRVWTSRIDVTRSDGQPP